MTLSPTQAAILARLAESPISIRGATLARDVGRAPGTVNSALSLLILRGLVERVGERGLWRFRLKPSSRAGDVSPTSTPDP